MSDPLRELLTDAVGLMHPAFVDASNPAGVQCEFYHQFRKLWDRGIPVGMGLGHLLVRVIDGESLGLHRLGENGQRDEAVAAIRFAEPFAAEPGFPRTFSVTAHNGRFMLQ